MTNRRAMELLLIERACVRRGSGMEFVIENSDDGCVRFEGYRKVADECDRDCANCVLVQDSRELLEMYDLVVRKMIEETEKEEGESKEWRDWQVECEKEPPRQLAI